MTQPELDDVEKKILLIICTKERFMSSVALAAELYETTEDVQGERVLEWTLVEQILEDLNVKGFVRYTLIEKDARGHRMRGYSDNNAEEYRADVITKIRPTHQAYEALAINIGWMTLVGRGHSLMERPKRIGDMTDFRSFRWAPPVQEPPTREDFIEHCGGCDHLDKHRRQLLELFGTDTL